LRYLESYEFGLVRESLHERALLLKLAPDLVQLQKFCLPLYTHMRRGPLLLRAGLTLYSVLSGFDQNARFHTIPRAQWGELDGLRTEGLKHVFSYTDARTDDALLTKAVMRSAESLGGELRCPAELLKAELVADGVQVAFRDNGVDKNCKARVLINAAGPWVNIVAERIFPEMTKVPVELVQGAHIEVNRQLGELYYYVESPRDGRAIFVMPREGRTIIGTTETRSRKHPDSVHPLEGEESYLLKVARHYFSTMEDLGRKDILASWAGLRVLPSGAGHAFHRSRETILHVDRNKRPRVLCIYGGKLTTYRATALKVIDRIAGSLSTRRAVASTDKLRLSL
jgi:glycerol-3-phosphate dehydrogenase